jgi:hypothetical protein
VSYISVAEADQIYSLAHDHAICPLAVESDEIRAFDERYLALRRALGDAHADDYWIRGLAFLRKARFNVLATPLPTANPALGLLAAIALTRESFVACDRIYPQHAAAVDTLCDAATDVLISNSDAVASVVAQAASAPTESSRTAVLLPQFGFHDPVVRHLRSLPGLERVDVLTASELQMRRPYDALFVIGRSSWYQSRRASWVFTAPRAREIFLTAYAWTFDRSLPPSRAFPRSRTSQSLTSAAQPILPDATSIASDESEIDVDWELLSRELSSGRGASDLVETVDARLLLLADGRVTFVGASDDSRVQVLDPEAQAGQRTSWVPTGEVVPGDFVLLRSEGGGDLIVEVADVLLGAAAARLREMQAEWKKRLAEQIASHGLDETVRALRSQGSPRASRGNVLNWSSPRSLRTADEADFFAVMRLVSLEREKRMYWNAMGQLDQAHRRAGFKIREQLEQEAERADLVELQTKGILDFTLPDGGGALTAFRVEDISPQTYAVPYQELGEPFQPRF